MFDEVMQSSAGDRGLEQSPQKMYIEQQGSFLFFMLVWNDLQVL